MRHRPWARLVAAVGGGVGLALSAPMLAAIGQLSAPDPILQIGPTARLVARGAAVAVPVRVVVTCPVGGEANVSMQVAQAVGREVGHAYGNAQDIPCDGTPQDVEVFAVSSDFTFRPGPAFATANLYCNFNAPPSQGSSCTAQAHREITIVGDFGPPVTPPPPTTPPPTIVPPPGPGPIPGFPDLGSFLQDLFARIGFPLGALA